MKTPGQIILFRFPRTDFDQGALRPALLLNRLPGEYDDWLMSMISSRTRHFIPGFDEMIGVDDSDFIGSGLKVSSIIRTGRLAVVDGDIMLGAIGRISDERLTRIKRNLSRWISGF